MAAAGEVAVEARPVGRAAVATTFASLGIYNYRLFWFGQLISLTGTWMQRLGQAWLVLRITDSAFAVGMVTALQFLPITCLSLFGGVLADRIPKRRLLIVTQSIAAVQALVLALLTTIGAINIGELYALVLVLGISNAFDNPARQSFPVELVGRKEVANAIALNSTLFNTSRIAGPALAGVAIATIGIAGCFWINAASFLGTICALVLMKPEQFHAVPPPQRRHPLKLLREGVSYSMHTPAVLMLLIALGFFGTFAYNFTVVLPLLSRFALHAGSLGYGFLFSAVGAGALLSALGLAYTRRQGVGTVFIGGGVFALVLFLLSLSRIYAISLVLLSCTGAFSIIYSASTQTRLQVIVPDEFRGRTMSLYTLLFAGSTPFGSLFIGAVSEHWNTQVALACAALLSALGLLLAWLYMRRLSPADLVRGTVLEEGSGQWPVGSQQSAVGSRAGEERRG